jgi:hypothetical protein
MRVIEKADIKSLEPLLCSIEAGTVILGRSERSIFDMIARGELEAVKSDRRTMLVYESLKIYVDKLRRLRPAKGTPRPHQRKPQMRQAEAMP